MEQSVLSKHFRKDYVGEGVLTSESSSHSQGNGPQQYEHCLYCRQKLISTYFVHREDLLKHISTVHPQEQQVTADMYEVIEGTVTNEALCSTHQLPLRARRTFYDPLAQFMLCELCRSEKEAAIKQAEYDALQSICSHTAQTDTEDFDLTQIPYSALVRVGRIFKEGELKYGRDNWRNAVGDKTYQLERANHALKHLLIYIHYLETGEYIGHYTAYATLTSLEGNREKGISGYEEDDLAKVLWFCVTQCELERLEKLRGE